MFEVKLKSGGTEKTFTKDYVNLEDNLLALDHQALQTSIISDEKAFGDPKKIRKLNEAYLKMFCDMYGNQFTVQDLKAADLSVRNKIDELFLAALGGTDEEAKEDDEKKEE